jgi:phospholipase C
VELDKVDTVFIVMMENRSFDHMLGYLELSPYNKPVVGIKDAWLKKFVNRYQGQAYGPWHRSEVTINVDPPHERGNIDVQIGGEIPNALMSGFVESYASSSKVSASDLANVMAYYTPAEVPITGFLADHFLVCDHWFACLPASTQPNRLMAMSGYAMRQNTPNTPLENQDLVYDWLDQKGVSWRVYHEGFPFFLMMPKVAERIATDLEHRFFRNLSWLKNDLVSQPDFPNVVFIEPTYTSGPHLPGSADDDHPTTSVASGQGFLRRVYDAVTTNTERWKKSVLVVAYDENGGFFDHVSPLQFTTPQNHGEQYPPFKTSGVRIPALIVSPLVQPGVYSGPLDHTSILKLLASLYGDGNYSPDVAAHTHVGNLKDLPPAPGNPGSNLVPPTAPPFSAPATKRTRPFGSVLDPLDLAFRNGLEYMREKFGSQAAVKFPEWSDYFTK